MKMENGNTELYLDQQPAPSDYENNKMVNEENGEPQVEEVDEETKKRLSWEEFYSSTTVHGFHFIFDQTGIRKIGWLIIFLGAFFLAGYLFIGVIYDYTSFTTLTSWVEKYSKDSPPFPSLTLCPFHSSLKRKILANETKDNELWETFEDFNRGVDESREFQQRLKKAMKETNSSNVSEFLSRYMLNKDDVFHDESLDAISSFLSCYFDTKSCDSKWFRTIQTRFYGTCFEFNYYEKDKESLRMVNLLPGFWLLLNIHSDSIALRNLLPADGVLLIIHPYGTVPMSSYATQIPIATGKINLIQLTTYKVKRLNPPYEDSCGEKDYKYLHKTFPYKKENCEFDCIAKMFMEEVGCLGFEYETLVDPKYICGADKYKEYKTKSTLFPAYEKICRKDCLSECDALQYKVTNSHLPLGTAREFEHLMKMKTNMTFEEAEKYVSKNIIGLNVQFATQSVMTSQVVPSVTWKSMLGSLGGNLGLCLGISVLTVCEFLYFGLNKFLSIYGKKT